MSLTKNYPLGVSIHSRPARRLVEGLAQANRMATMIEFKPRFFVLPAIALTVLAMLYIPADGGRAAQGECGPVVRIADPGIRASFAEMQRRQSQAASDICAVYANNLR
jgi:hypothetical protein